MSLDVYLKGPEQTVRCECNNCGNKHGYIDRPDWFEANITHNLGAMADAAGIYKALWHPEEVGINTAADLIEPLEKGLALMRADRQKFEAFNAKNGWGLYENFVPWIERYLAACKEYPTAGVEVSR